MEEMKWRIGDGRNELEERVSTMSRRGRGGRERERAGGKEGRISLPGVPHRSSLCLELWKLSSGSSSSTVQRQVHLSSFHSVTRP